MQIDELAKHRFESFKLGLPSTAAPAVPQHRHRRSHSRNASISSTASLPTPKCTTTHDIPPTQSLPPPPKRNSHHRRVSSVSTRRESAEMMGVSVSETMVSPPDDSAEKDSIRRHALWALEGKRDASYTKVEIPELPTPFEFPTKPSFPPGSGAAFMSTGKRDSFKPSLAKDLLHTLVEEEEEEEDSDRPRAPPTPTTPTTSASMRGLGTRPRPAQLSLRPLSLTPDNLPSQNPPSHNLPTPLSQKRLSLKSLTLTPDTMISNATVMNPNTTAPSPTPLRSRPVLNIKLTAEPSVVSSEPLEETDVRPQPLRRSSISYKSSSTTVTSGLPTPEATPTSTDRRFSSFSHSSISSRGSLSGTNSNRVSTTEDDFLTASAAATRPLSASEQHFLFKSHNALLTRITDLERALSFRNNGASFREGGSRPSSVASAVSAVSGSSSSSEPTGEPLDEMLRLVADLKGERDELKRDVEGWRVRVGDMEKQLGLLGNRLESERRDAWVARSRVGLVEVERAGLEKRVSELESDNQRLLEGEEQLKEQVARLLREKEKMAAELKEAKALREMDPLSTPRAFDGPVVAMRPVVPPTIRGPGFTSLDSESSVTDVEDSGFRPLGLGLGFKLQDVDEEGDDDESGLAGYEDEDEDDVLLSPSSSFGSVDELHSTPRTVLDVAPQPAPVPATAPTYQPMTNWTFPKGPQPAPAPTAPAPTHLNRPSISKWTFPRGVQPVEHTPEVEVDRFFGCLEDLDNPPSPSSPKYLEYDEEKAKGMFAKGFSRSDDVKSCFVFPASVLATGESTFCELDVVEEEEEEEDEEEGETEGETVVEDGEINNGIKITFTPPEDRELDEPLPAAVSPSPSPKSVLPSAFVEDEDEGEEESAAVPFNFGRPPVTPERTPPPPSNSRSVSPSSIPRPTMVKPAHFTLASPPRSGTDMSAFVTPPTKRGGTMPSFIPQPSSPSRFNSQKSPPPFATNTSMKPSTTFIRQPARQPLMPKPNVPKTQHTNADASPHSFPRYADNAAAHPGSDMNSVDLSDRNIPTGPNAASCSNTSSVPASSSFSSIMSSPLAGRLSFQTLTNYIPSWGMTQTPGPSSDAAGHNSTRAVAAPAGTVKRGYVSKQSQLERLKSRLEREGHEGRSALVRRSDSDGVFL
ncbi:hypothetical protein DFH08DRAFT_9549 [Mycena albidolilacea]|uniref:Uncharacterized protein n=1 Tax=Mycena albidolilacea TaxID=1033008 RepID=A0AAD7F6B8_9AGAR|nr:hypothetical protein DFH08DRAFT_9549 [Mycena albidolilacea]